MNIFRLILLTILGASLSACPAGSNGVGNVGLGDPIPTNSGGSNGDGITASGKSAGNLVIWANNGEDKVVQDDLRATNGDNVGNATWDGSKIIIFGARNEVVNFNLVLESNIEDAKNVEVTFDELINSTGSTISSVSASGDSLFNYNDRNIELFFVRYLQIKGISEFLSASYDQRHLPVRWRLPHSSNGIVQNNAVWTDRADHDKNYPDIAVPLELENNFTIAKGTNQSIYADIYIPSTTEAGIYIGKILIAENGTSLTEIPVELTVRNFTLPDVPTAKTMLVIGDYENRYSGNANELRTIHDRHFQMAHRHKISLIDGDYSGNGRPSAAWEARLNGALFTSANGYSGPGYGEGNGVYSIGTYGSWTWKSGGASAMRTNSNAWVNWFNANSPSTEYFLYLIDESSNYAQIEQWAGWIANNPGVGNSLKSLVTLGSTSNPVVQTPTVDIPTINMYVGETIKWNVNLAAYKTDASKRFYMYNGGRPATGSFMTEDDGVALRQLAWAQYKMGVDRWFYWQGTYYNNYQGGMGETKVFSTAQTFGSHTSESADSGEDGWNYSNGDGLLFYPGTDNVHPDESYGIRGPIASLRLKHWRRGIQDTDYLAMANDIDPARTQAIINSVVPKVLWEYGVSDSNDPTWVRTDISWSDNPDVWEAARKALADIIESAN